MKTKFEEYLEADIMGDRNLAEADLALERRLAKKLKVKEGNLRGDDEINLLFEGIPSVVDYSKDGQMQILSRKDLDDRFSAKILKPCKRLKKDQKTERTNDSGIRTSKQVNSSSADVVLEKFPNKAPTKYVLPCLRSHCGDGSEEYGQLRRNVRGLLNRLSEANVESITGEIFALLELAGRSVWSQIVREEVVTSCSRGPRGNEQYATVFAASVTGMTCLVGIDFGADLIACLAKCFEEEYLKEDNLSLRNLSLLLSYLYVFGICSRILLTQTQEDSWTWTLEESKIYSVQTAYATLLEDSPIDGHTSETYISIWNTLAPSKVAALIWGMLRDRLPTRSNLTKRNIFMGNEAGNCVMCSLTEETANHLFFCCPESYSLWMKCYSWLGFYTALPSDSIAHHWNHHGLWTRKRGRKAWMTIWCSVLWTIWIHRNNLCFKGSNHKEDDLLETVIHRAWFWITNRGNNRFLYSFVDWRREPLICLLAL